jgi:hypothetical protein
MSIPNYVQPPVYTQQPRQSRRGLWMALGIAGGLIVIMGVVFSLLLATGVIVGLNAFFQTTSEPTPVAAHYYLNIMTHDYAKAYADLDSNATINGERVDLQSFITMASASDAQNGSVSGYSIDDALQGSDPSHLTITVHRGARTYEVHLQLQQEGSAWKIVSADGI